MLVWSLGLHVVCEVLALGLQARCSSGRAPRRGHSGQCQPRAGRRPCPGRVLAGVHALATARLSRRRRSHVPGLDVCGILGTVPGHGRSRSCRIVGSCLLQVGHAGLMFCIECRNIPVGCPHRRLSCPSLLCWCEQYLSSDTRSSDCMVEAVGLATAHSYGSRHVVLEWRLSKCIHCLRLVLQAVLVVSDNTN
jgi:hypothetical protein